MKNQIYFLKFILICVAHILCNIYAMEDIPAAPTQLPQEITVKLMDDQKEIARYKFTYNQYAPFSFLKNTVEDLGTTKIPIPVQNINKNTLDFIYENIKKIENKPELHNTFNALGKRRPEADFFINQVKTAADFLGNDSLLEICHTILLERAENYFKQAANRTFIQQLSTPDKLNSFLKDPKKVIAELLEKRPILQIDEYMLALANKIPFQENAPNLQWRTIKQLPFHISLTTFSPDKTFVALGSINPHKITLLQLPGYTFYKEFEIPTIPTTITFSNDNKKLYVGGENTLFEIDIESGNISEFNVQVPVKEFWVGQIKISPNDKFLACFIIYKVDEKINKYVRIFNINNKNQAFSTATYIYNFQFYTDQELLLDREIREQNKMHLIVAKWNLINGEFSSKVQFTAAPGINISDMYLDISSDKKQVTWLFKISSTHTSNIRLTQYSMPTFKTAINTLITPPWEPYKIKISSLKDLSIILFQIPVDPYSIQILKYNIPSKSVIKILRNKCPGLTNKILAAENRIHLIFENGSIEMHDPAITFSLDQKLFVNGILQYYKQHKKIFALTFDSELYEIWQTFNSIQQEQLKSYVTIEGEPIEPPAKKPKLEETGEELRGLEGKEEI